MADIEAAVADYLAAQRSCKGYNDMPDRRPDTFIVVQRIGGPREGLIHDNPQLTVECYAKTRALASALAENARTDIAALKGQVISGITVYRTNEVSGPVHLPNPLSTSPRFTFTAALQVRSEAPY